LWDLKASPAAYTNLAATEINSSVNEYRLQSFSLYKIKNYIYYNKEL